ncbi:MAG: IS110 family transposase, partial [Thermoanaerobaculia bacterium]|nr:IS110 family transposase [Thermoanaerobaculia bacterium]
GCECIFCWYWLADLCEDEGIAFALGHALGMRLIYGTKTKSDRFDSEKIARLLRLGHFPLAYTYPRTLRATRALLRRRLFFARRCAELLSHLQISQSQYNLERTPARLDRAANRAGLAEHFPSGSARLSIGADCSRLDALDALIDELERTLVRAVKVDDLASFYRLRTIPGIGETLAMTIHYEVPDFDCFDTVQQFASYARLVAPRGESSGKLGGSRGRRQGDVHLKWAFSEAAVLLLRANPRAQKLHARLVKRLGRAKALSVLAHKLGRAVFHMQKRQQPFDAERFYREA